MSEEISNESLQKSIKTVGELYPVLENQDGKILDGNHRVQSNPAHHRKTVQTKNRAEEILVRLHAHPRRQVPQEETKALLLELAQELEKSGTPKENVTAELCKVAPFSERYVRLLMPQEMKRPEKVESGQKGGQVSAELFHQTVKTQETPLRECERCHIHTSNGGDFHGHHLCGKHLEAANLNPAGYDGFFRTMEKGKNGELPKAFKPQDTWAHREAQMHVSPSKMELTLLEKLTQIPELRPIQTQRTFMLLATTPDFFLPSKNLAVYVDGKEAHKGREDRDNQLRDMLRKRGFNVLSLPYSGESEAEVQRLVDAIKEA